MMGEVSGGFGVFEVCGRGGERRGDGLLTDVDGDIVGCVLV